MRGSKGRRSYYNKGLGKKSPRNGLQEARIGDSETTHKLYMRFLPVDKSVGKLWVAQGNGLQGLIKNHAMWITWNCG